MKRLKCYLIIGILFVILTGTISHFVYEWSGDCVLLGFFFPVSESTWEHMKLLFFPMLLFSAFLGKRREAEIPCLTSALFFGTLFGTFLIPVLFYTYTGVLGRNYPALDIATFVLSVLLAFLAVYRLALSCRAESWLLVLELLLFLLVVCFFVFTYHPPALGIFADPTASSP